MYLKSQEDFISSGPDEICMWLSCIKKGEENLLKMIKEKNITGKDIKLIADVFVPLIDELKIKNVGENEIIDEDKKEKEGKENISSRWKEDAPFSRETFYLGAETVLIKSKVPEMGVSGLPIGDFKGEPSSLDVFQRMPPDFYEPLDKAFESASFENIEDIRKVSQEKAAKLEEDKTLRQLGMSREEAEVLFSYTYEAKEGKTPCYIMNKILYEHDDDKLRGHRGYILHLLKALRRLKPVLAAGTTLYRGIDGKFLKFDDDHYKVGNALTWPAFTSTSIKESVAYSFIKMINAEKPIIFEIRGAFVGYSIKTFSNFPKEEEVLLEPETTFRVVSIEDDAKDPRAKRIVVDVKSTPLMIKEAVENFGKTEWNLQHPEQQQINKEILPPEWVEVVSPSGETFFLNIKTGTSLLEAPEMSMSDLPFGVFVGKPSVLDVFQRMPPDFYEPLDKAFESFDYIEDFKKKSQEKVVKLEKNGTLEKLGMSREEAGVLFSYLFVPKNDWEKAPYRIIKGILYEHDDDKLRKYRGYILHLLKALRRLKPIPTMGKTLYRVVNANSKRFDEEHYKVGNTLTLPAFTSTSIEENVAYDFMKWAEQPIIFEIHGDFVGYRIGLFSNFPNEDEILLEPETTFKVVSIENDAKNQKAKRIKLEVQPTPLMIKDAVENFAKAECDFFHQNNK